ncbi:enoyl-CoA hydratase/isomerase family protein [Aliikangiella sp. IMCC44359]|uniref:enoyl-CoA hydratase/isomerase family protein n=1 Tax=Aliikangiella sp. IMCC44359 TaxID=3459125 RepID=UPI00403B1824
MSEQQILSRLDGSVFELQINRPEKMNALTDQMYGDLVEGIRKAEADEKVKVLLIRSSGAHFSAGNDLADFLQTAFNFESNVVQFLISLAKMTKPVIAAVNGAAVGIGTTMLLHCDLVFAAQDAKFSLPFIKLGLTPEGGSSQLLAQRCGTAKANDWLLTGRTFLADEACSSGLVNQVFQSAESTWLGAMSTAQKMSKNSLEVLIESKKLIKGEQVASVIELIKREAEIFAQRLSSTEAKAAFNAFLNR